MNNNIAMTTEKNLNRDMASALHRIHQQALPNDIFPNLTRGCYRGVMDKAIRAGQLSVVWAGKTPVGFCVIAPSDALGGESSLAWYGSLAVSFAKMLAQRPKLLCEILSGVCYKSRIVPHNAFEIFALCLMPDYQSSGIGKQLMDHALAALSPNGASSLWARTSNTHAEKFYVAYGFLLAGEEKRCARRLSVLQLPARGNV